MRGTSGLDPALMLPYTPPIRNRGDAVAGLLYGSRKDKDDRYLRWAALCNGQTRQTDRSSWIAKTYNAALAFFDNRGIPRACKEKVR